MYLKWMVFVLGIILQFNPCIAKSLVHTENVAFDTGSNKTTVYGMVKGSNTVNYRIFVKKGQMLHVNLDSSVVYFNIFSPHKGIGDTPMFMGSIDGGDYVARLSKNGTYTIQVSLISSEAKKGTKALYSLTLGLD